MRSNYREWEQIYREYPPSYWGWELDRPRPILTEFIDRGLIKKGNVLDLCCGAGTNTIYLAEKGFDVTGTDISKRAIEYAKKNSEKAAVLISFMLQSFTDLSFRDDVFDFVFDMGCFHHVKIVDRNNFIKGICRVMKECGIYLLTCFSYKNGSPWNHFTKKQIISLFGDYFKINEIKHYASVEGDDMKRYFYTTFMRKK